MLSVPVFHPFESIRHGEPVIKTADIPKHSEMRMSRVKMLEVPSKSKVDL